MGQEIGATALRHRALEFLQEGGDDEAAEWLKACPLLDGEARRGFGDGIQVVLEFGCSRRNMQAFQDEDGYLADQVYTALNAVSSPHHVSYSIRLRYLTTEELGDARDDVILELPEASDDDPPF